METTERGLEPLKFERRIVSGIEALIAVMDEMEAFCASSGLPEAVTVQLMLVLEELATNAIKYGYREGARGEIDIDLALSGNLISLTVADDGDAFDPTAVPAPDVERGLEERRIGGLGIHLVMRMMDAVRYQRRDGRNIVIVNKYTSAGHSGERARTNSCK
ncbi:MAG: ATP-binding protein [Methylococcus sp.]|nr:ATP-binding protein [Methylococcus sp.]